MIEYTSGTTEGPDFDDWWATYGRNITGLQPQMIALAGWSAARAKVQSYVVARLQAEADLAEARQQLADTQKEREFLVNYTGIRERDELRAGLEAAERARDAAQVLADERATAMTQLAELATHYQKERDAAQQQTQELKEALKEAVSKICPYHVRYETEHHACYCLEHKALRQLFSTLATPPARTGDQPV